LLITFEGIDRSGKTTQAGLLADALGEEALLVREPGGTPAAERIRELVKDPAQELSPIAETLLFGAARAELVATVIRPALREGRIVVCDRYIDSTVAYQGGARGLGIEKVEELNRWITDGPRPGTPDRLEAEGEPLQHAVAVAYEELAARHSDRYIRIDATRSPEEVHADVLALTRERLGAGVVFPPRRTGSEAVAVNRPAIRRDQGPHSQGSVSQPQVAGLF
jgi:dTMP kinase